VVGVVVGGGWGGGTLWYLCMCWYAPVFLSLCVASSLGVQLCSLFDVGLCLRFASHLDSCVVCAPRAPTPSPVVRRTCWGATHDPTLSLSVFG